MPSRILVFSASVGAGHLRAAQAVELALREMVPSAQVRNIDVLELTNSTFRQVYGKAYIDLVNKAPHVLGYMYDMLDRPSKEGKRDKFRLAFEKLNLGQFADLLCQDPPDLVINTHFLPAEIIAHLRRERKCDVVQVTVTTDFEAHRMWVNEPCEHYFTATEEGAVGLSAWGIPLEKITATGIPIHPVFAQPKDRAEMVRKHGLSGDRPIVLQLAGGFGVGPIEKIYRSILQVERPLEIIAVTGKNADARTQLQAISCPDKHRAHVLGFTTEMDELLCVADLVVSKPGGLTTSETLARGAAMVIVDPIPGQESRNSDYLLEHGAAVKINNLAVLPYKIGQILSEPARLRQLKDNAKRLGHPRAAYQVVEKALSFLRRRMPTAAAK